MIGANPETAKRIASQLRARSKAFTFPTGTEALCNQLLETVDSTAFPGALVPEQAADGEFLVVFGVCYGVVIHSQDHQCVVKMCIQTNVARSSEVFVSFYW